MEKQIFYNNESAYLAKLESIKRTRTLLQDLLDEFNKFPLSFSIDTMEALNGLAHGGGQWIKAHILEATELSSAYGNFRLKGSSIADQIDLGHPEERLNALGRKVAPYLNNGVPGENGADIDYLTLSGSIVEINQDAVNELQASYILYTEDDVELKALEAHRVIVQALDDFRKIFPVSLHFPIKDLVLFREDGTIAPRYYYYHTKRSVILNKRYQRRNDGKE